MGLPPLVEPGPPLTTEQAERYARHVSLAGLGRLAQRRLLGARVLVVGAGGLGSPVLLYLAAAGVGTLGVVDHDVVDLSNLQRQVLHGSADVGRPKVDTAREGVARLDPAVTVHVHPVRLDASTALETLAGYDVVVDATDNFPARYLLDDACALLGLPLVWGSIHQNDGQVTVFWADPPPDHPGVTYRDVFPEAPAPGTVPSCAEAGVLGALCGTIGSLMASEVVKLVTGTGEPLLGRLLTFDAASTRFREVPVRADPQRTRVTELVDLDTACEVSTPPAGAPDQTTFGTISAADLAARLAARESGDDDLELVDVREPHEHRVAAIPGARLLPLGAFTDGTALAQLDPGRPLVVHCASGVRSAQAAHLAHERGFDVVHLAGGIEAWLELAPLG